MDDENVGSGVFNMKKVRAGTEAWQSKVNSLKSDHETRLTTNPSLGGFSLAKARGKTSSPAAPMRTANVPKPPSVKPKTVAATATKPSSTPDPKMTRPEFPDDFPQRLKDLDWDTDKLKDFPTPDENKYDWLEPDEHGGWKPSETPEQPDEDETQDDAINVPNDDSADAEVAAAASTEKPQPHESLNGIKDHGDYVEIPEGLNFEVSADYSDEDMATMGKAIIAIKLAGHAQKRHETSPHSLLVEIEEQVEQYFDRLEEDNNENIEVGLAPRDDPYDGDYDKLLKTITNFVGKDKVEDVEADPVDMQGNADLEQEEGLSDEGTYINIPLDYDFAIDLRDEESPLAMQARIATELAQQLFKENKNSTEEMDDEDLEFAIEGIIEQHNVETFGTSYPDDEADPFGGDFDKLGQTIYQYFNKLKEAEDLLEPVEDTIEVANVGMVDDEGNQAESILPEPIKVSASKSGNVPHLAADRESTETLCGRPVVYNHKGYENYAVNKPTCKRCENRRAADLRTANVLAAAEADDAPPATSDPQDELKQFLIKYETREMALQEKADSFSPAAGTLPIGAEGTNERIQAHAISTFLQMIKKGATPDAAAAKTIEDAVGWINTHNSRRPEDLNWQRSAGWIPIFVDRMKQDLPKSYAESNAGQLAGTQEFSEEQIDQYFQSLTNSQVAIDIPQLAGFKRHFVKDITSEEWDSVVNYDNPRDQMLQLWQVADAAANRNPESLSIDHVERLLVDQGVAELIQMPAYKGDMEHLFSHKGKIRDVKDHKGEMFRGYDGQDYIINLPSNHPDLKKTDNLEAAAEAVDFDLAARTNSPDSAFNFWDVLDYKDILAIESRRNGSSRFNVNAMRYVGELANAIQNAGSKYSKRSLIEALNEGGYDDAKMKRRVLLNGKPGQADLHGSFIDLSDPSAGSTLYALWRHLKDTIKLLDDYDNIESRLQNETPQQIFESMRNVDDVISHWNRERDGNLQIDPANPTPDQLKELLIAELFQELDLQREVAWDYSLQQHHSFFDTNDDELFQGDDSLRPPILTPDQILPDRPASATVKVGHAGKSKNLAAGLDYNGQPIDFRSQDVANEQIKVWQEQAREIGATQDNGHKLILSLFDWTGNWSQPWIDAGYKVVRVDARTDGDFSIDRWFYTQMEDWQDSYGYVEGIIAACPCTAFTATSARHRKTKHDREDEYGKEWLAKTFGYWSTMYGNNVKEFTTWLVGQTREIIEFANPRFHAIENPGIASRIGDLTGIHKPLMLFDPYMYGDPYTKSTGLWGSFNTNLPLNPVNPDEGSKIQSKLSGNNPMQKAMRSITPLGFSSSFFLANHVNDQYDREDYSARNIQRFRSNRTIFPPIGGNANQYLQSDLRTIIKTTLQ